MRKFLMWPLIAAALFSLLLTLDGHRQRDASAKIPLQETPPGDYPGPPATPTTNRGYPAPAAATLTIPTPYPATDSDSSPEGAPTATAVSVIGDDLAPTNRSSNTNAPLSTGEMLRNRGLLWGGFLVTLLIFGAGIYGAIAIYTRKQE